MFSFTRQGNGLRIKALFIYNLCYFDTNSRTSVANLKVIKKTDGLKIFPSVIVLNKTFYYKISKIINYKLINISKPKNYIMSFLKLSLSEKTYSAVKLFQPEHGRRRFWASFPKYCSIFNKRIDYFFKESASAFIRSYSL